MAKSKFKKHKRTFYVDIPTNDEMWINVEVFKTKKEALKFAKDKFGSDSKGRVCLISVS